MTEQCRANSGGVIGHYSCNRVKGHRGDHKFTVSWPSTPEAIDAEVSPPPTEQGGGATWQDRVFEVGLSDETVDRFLKESSSNQAERGP